MDHDEYLERCKAAARECMQRGEYHDAVASMLSDLSKHPDWASGKLVSTMTMLYAINPSPENARRIIEGFK